MLIFGLNFVLAIGVSQLNGYLPRPFRRLRDAVAGLDARVVQWMRVLAGGVINFSLQLERWERQANGWLEMRRKRDAIDSSEEREI
jgi:methylmalonyl-CoA mutase cobalamin-binding subunit